MRWLVELTLVGAAEPGYDPYVVVTTSPPLTVTVAVTVTTDAAAVVDAAAAVVEVPLALAAAWNWAKLLPGFTAKTIPCWQWPV